MINKTTIQNVKNLLNEIEFTQNSIKVINDSVKYGRNDVMLNGNYINIEVIIPFDEFKRRAVEYYTDKLETLQEKLRLTCLDMNKQYE